MKAEDEKCDVEERLSEATARHYKALMDLASVTAEKAGYDAQGWDAFYVLFAEKFGWTPSQVRSLSEDELGLMLDAFFSASRAKPKSRRAASLRQD